MMPEYGCVSPGIVPDESMLEFVDVIPYERLTDDLHCR